MNLEMLVMWIVVGLVAGCLAGIVMKGGGYGLIGGHRPRSRRQHRGKLDLPGPWGFCGSGAVRGGRRRIHRGGPRDRRRARAGRRTRVRARLAA